MENLLPARSWDSRGFTNGPLTAPMAGSNEVMVTGLAMINRLALAHGRSQGEGAAATDPAVQLNPPWRGQGHPSKVGAMEVPPGRRPPQGNCDGAPCLPKKNAGSNEGQPPQGGGQKPPAPPAAGNCGGASVLSYTKAGGRLPCGGNSPVPPQLGKCDGRPCPGPAPVAGGGSVTPPPVWPGGACVGSSCAPRPTPHPWPLPVPPPVIGQTNLPPRGPIPPIMTQAGPPPPQAPKPPTDTHAAPPPPTPPQRIAQVPPKDEHRYVPDEILFELAPGVSPRTAAAIAGRERLQLLASQSLELIGTALYRYKIKDRRSVPTVVAVLERDARIGTVQPNYLYTLQGEQNGGFSENQYAIPTMRLTEAHTISNGDKALVAVIDSGVDTAHPEIAGAVTEPRRD
jgi:hypothetical protein